MGVETKCAILKRMYHFRLVISLIWEMLIEVLNHSYPVFFWLSSCGVVSGDGVVLSKSGKWTITLKTIRASSAGLH